MTLACDIISLFHPAGKQTVYGLKGEKVTLIAEHGHVLIVQGKKGRFSVSKIQIMKIVYIAHSIAGDIESNLADLRRIIRRVNLEMPDVVPFCPYYADVVSLNDNVSHERSKGIMNNCEILNSGIVNELWLTGTIKSGGMIAEEILAKQLSIPVIDFINRL